MAGRIPFLRLFSAIVFLFVFGHGGPSEEQVCGGLGLPGCPSGKTCVAGLCVIPQGNEGGPCNGNGTCNGSGHGRQESTGASHRQSAPRRL